MVFYKTYTGYFYFYLGLPDVHPDELRLIYYNRGIDQYREVVEHLERIYTQ